MVPLRPWGLTSPVSAVGCFRRAPGGCAGCGPQGERAVQGRVSGGAGAAAGAFAARGATPSRRGFGGAGRQHRRAHGQAGEVQSAAWRNTTPALESAEHRTSQPQLIPDSHESYNLATRILHYPLTPELHGLQTSKNLTELSKASS